jgi:hypothetical protein
MHPYHHALSSAKKHGGEPHDYMEIHAWFDETKAFFGDARHRALRHHTAGIFWCEQQFGSTIPLTGCSKRIPTRLIAEQHVMAEMNRVPIRHKDEELTALALAAQRALYSGEG